MRHPIHSAHIGEPGRLITPVESFGHIQGRRVP
jgi:hypothetical protein